MSEKTIILLHETVAQSWARDASTFALFTALIGLGWLIDSTVMQFVGAGMGILALTLRSSAVAHRFTIEQARSKLDELEGAR